jgi:signal transduction histidine kinase
MSWHRPEAGRDNTARFEAWERLEAPALAALPYIMLVAASALEIVLSAGLRGTLITLGVAALTAAWLLWGFTLHPAWRERPRRMGMVFTVLIILMAVLVVRAPIYGFFTFTGYFFTFWLPYGRWRIIGVVSVAILTATSQDGGLPQATPVAIALYAGFILVNVAVAGGIIWFSYVGAEQNDRRRQAVADLSEANRKLEATLAENAGLHEQLLTQAREAGVHDERQRMAREIHDTLAQSLTGIVTQLQAADQVGQDGERRRHLDAALQLAREGISEARRSVNALRPEPLQAGRIEEALTVVSERWAGLHGVHATVTTTGSATPMSPEAELTLLRTAQEALANVAKHAGATRVGLTLSYIGDQVTLDIRDDGVGFAPGPGTEDPAVSGSPANGTAANGSPANGSPANGSPGNGSPANGSPVYGGRASSRPANGGPANGAPLSSIQLSGGFGLTAMRQRVEGLAGTLEIESEPGIGTTISASLPVTVATGAANQAASGSANQAANEAANQATGRGESA